MTPLQIKRRIREKLGCPQLFTRKQLPDSCLIWPTTRDPNPRPMLKKIRDRDYRPYMAPVLVHPLAKITINKETHYVHRLIHQLMNPDVSPFRATQVCSTTFCVHPGHWVFRPTGHEPPPEAMPSYLPPEEQPWTPQDAMDLLDIYLLDHPYPPLLREHNLLIDIPDDLLFDALRKIRKEHLIP